MEVEEGDDDAVVEDGEDDVEAGVDAPRFLRKFRSAKSAESNRLNRVGPRRLRLIAPFFKSLRCVSASSSAISPNFAVGETGFSASFENRRDFKKALEW